MLVEKGEVSGYDDLLGRDAAAAGSGGGAGQLPHLGVFIDAQLPGKGGDQLQRVELRLPGEFDRARHRKGQRQCFGKFRGDAQGFQRPQLLFKLAAVIERIDVRIRFLQVAVDTPGQRAVLPQRLLVGTQVLGRSVGAEFPDQAVVDQTVLSGDLCRGVFGDAAAEGFGLDQRIVHPRLLQKPGAQNARHSAANDEHIGFQIPVQALKPGKRRRLFP